MIFPQSKSMSRLAFIRPALALGLIAHVGLGTAAESGVHRRFRFQTNDVVAFVGGANTVAAQEFGFLEALLIAAEPDLRLRFRNLAREGDTAKAQPRDVKFPSLPQQLDHATATAVCVQFGQAEALEGATDLSAFVSAYREFIEEAMRPDRRIILISPTPFETAGPSLPDLSKRNEQLRQLVEATRLLAAEMKLGFVDLFSPEPRLPKPAARLTSNGIHLTPLGHWHYDRLAAIRLGFDLNLDGIEADPATGALSRSDWETLREAIVKKNRLWFDYSRPMNWAFLGGDRVEQPSSRDHRDLKVRWFPVEMEQFLPLIREAENQVYQLARLVRIGPEPSSQTRE